MFLRGLIKQYNTVSGGSKKLFGEEEMVNLHSILPWKGVVLKKIISKKANFFAFEYKYIWRDKNVRFDHVYLD